MKKTLLIVLSLVFVGSLLGCSSGGDAGATAGNGAKPAAPASTDKGAAETK